MLPVLPALAVLSLATAASLASQTPPAPPAGAVLSAGSISPEIRAAFRRAQQSTARLRATLASVQSILALDSLPDEVAATLQTADEVAEGLGAVEVDAAAVQRVIAAHEKSEQAPIEFGRLLNTIRPSVREVAAKLGPLIGGGPATRTREVLAQLAVRLGPDGLDRLAAALAAGGGDPRADCLAAIRSAYQRLRASISSTYERLLRKARGNDERVRLGRQRDGVLEQLKRAELAKLRECERGA